MDPWAPELTVRELGHGCRLSLCGIAHGDGVTLQQAADRLVDRLVDVALVATRSRAGFGAWPPRDPRALNFLREIARLKHGGGDVRERALGARWATRAGD